VKRKILIVLILAFFLCGCVAGIGGTEKVEQPTVGQELTDLKKALDEGAVTEKEYMELKQKIMNRKE
jgi:PBP1b-binding outer membrane lipoprotein LpoB